MGELNCNEGDFNAVGDLARLCFADVWPGDVEMARMEGPLELCDAPLGAPNENIDMGFFPACAVAGAVLSAAAEVFGAEAAIAKVEDQWVMGYGMWTEALQQTETVAI